MRTDGASAAQSRSGSGWPTVAVSVCATPSGGPVSVGPSCANLITGGWFPVAAFSKKLIQYGGLVQKETVDVWPLIVIVQVSFWLPKSFGTRIEKTPCWRLGSK